jgi:4-amino-4-deoxy-L-arabinose transferase-like glycosyltransferase
MPDEAQYWTWSLFPDIGYYSKPPGIAWQIAAGTVLFGHTALGVRFLALLLPIASALVIRAIVKIAGWRQ